MTRTVVTSLPISICSLYTATLKTQTSNPTLLLIIRNCSTIPNPSGRSKSNRIRNASATSKHQHQHQHQNHQEPTLRENLQDIFEHSFPLFLLFFLVQRIERAVGLERPDEETNDAEEIEAAESKNAQSRVHR